MAALSIRLRLAFWYSAVLLIGLVCFGYGMWFALHQHLVAGIDNRLAQQAEGLRIALEDEGVAADRRQIQEEVFEAGAQNPGGASIQLRRSDGEVILSSSQGPLFGSVPFQAVPTYRTVQREGRQFRTFARRIQCRGAAFDLLINFPLDDVRDVMRDFRNLLMMMIPGVLAVASLGGWWISRRALAPVDEITNVAKSITAKNLSKRLAVPQTGDELQRMSETWNEVLARLEIAVERARRFTADASHELRTPVALIRSTAELALRRERAPEDYRKALEQIEAEARRMTALTNDLLFLASADADTVEMTLSPLDLSCIAADAVRENLALSESKGVCIRADLPENPCMALANDAGIRRLLRILIDNALKFTQPAGTVVVSASSGQGKVTLSVRDTGQGIPSEALPHIFERFYQADQSHGGNPGAGLGLSIAQTIARAHGSVIHVESAPGRGSNFSLALKK